MTSALSEVSGLEAKRLESINPTGDASFEINYVNIEDNAISDQIM